MHASSKAATLGTAFILLAIAPVAAQVIARAGYRGGVPLAQSTGIDEYRPRAYSGQDNGEQPR